MGVRNSPKILQLQRIMQLYTKKTLVTSHVQIQSDNATAEAYLNKQGGTRSQELVNLTFKISEVREWQQELQQDR